MLGVDIGTTNVKAALYTYTGEEITVASASYELYMNEEGAATQEILDIKEATFEVLRKVITECRVKGIQPSFLALSSAMHSLLAVDQKGVALMPVMTWGDRRAQKYIEQLKNKKGTDLYKRTGTPIHPMSPLLKLIWLKNEQPELFKKAARFVGIKSYLLHELFGEYYTDYSIANATGLFNMHTLAWDKEALEIADITEKKLPQLVPTTKILKGMKPSIAKDLGLDVDFPVVIGASDGCLANLGVGAWAEGKLALTIGTSGAIRSTSSVPLTDEKERTFCYALTEKHWVIGGPVNNGGVVFDWARENFFTKSREKTNSAKEYQKVMELIETIPIGADDLYFHPYLVGERAPIWRSEVKGSFTGLALHHRDAHMLRAVLEGINFNLYAVYQAIAEMIGTKTKQIRVTGGFTKSSIWLQMIADIFGVELAVTNVTENGCFGAALLGLLALGEITDFTEVEDIIPIAQIIEPQQKRNLLYQEHFQKYLHFNQYILNMYDEN